MTAMTNVAAKSAGLIAVILFASQIVVPGAKAHDLRPTGDGKISTTPQSGYIFSCRTQFRPVTRRAGLQKPWIHGNEWDPLEKPVVEGAVNWPDAAINVSLDGDTRIIRANNLPTHTTGIFPISPSDPAYRYDPNPNAIRKQDILLRLPANPQPAAEPRCVMMGMIGFALTGAALYNSLDANGTDATVHEILDHCGAHPQSQGQYHYHDLSPCMVSGRQADGHSELLGYALDGFGLFGPYETAGDATLTNAGLDACHGHEGAILWDGEPRTMYHYHLNAEFPYSIGCFTGTPIRVPRSGPAHRVRQRGVAPQGTHTAPLREQRR